MMKQVLIQFPWLELSSLGLLIFFTFFVVLLVLVFLPSQRDLQQRLALLPLDDAKVGDNKKMEHFHA